MKDFVSGKICTQAIPPINNKHSHYSGEVYVRMTATQASSVFLLANITSVGSMFFLLYLAYCMRFDSPDYSACLLGRFGVIYQVKLTGSPFYCTEYYLFSSLLFSSGKQYSCHIFTWVHTGDIIIASLYFSFRAKTVTTSNSDDRWLVAGVKKKIGSSNLK